MRKRHECANIAQMEYTYEKSNVLLGVLTCGRCTAATCHMCTIPNIGNNELSFRRIICCKSTTYAKKCNQGGNIVVVVIVIVDIIIILIIVVNIINIVIVIITKQKSQTGVNQSWGSCQNCRHPQRAISGLLQQLPCR